MDISFMNEYMSPVIVGVCLCVGYILKHWVHDCDNRIIPTVCGGVGIIMAFWMHWGAISPAVILEGMASGLAATGLHQAYRQYLEAGEN